jgi:hypothetical protein
MAKAYDIAKASGRCRGCDKELVAGEEFQAALFDAEEGFRRDDFCLACWEQRRGQLGGAFSIWRGRVSEPQQPVRQYVDDQVLVEFFDRLAEENEPAKVNFRFVLALMLMRKKLLVYDGSARDAAGQDVWTMHFKNAEKPVPVIHPQLDDEQIAQVTGQLGSIFQT